MKPQISLEVTSFLLIYAVYVTVLEYKNDPSVAIKLKRKLIK